MQNSMTMAQEIMHLLSSKHVQHQPAEHLCIILSAKSDEGCKPQDCEDAARQRKEVRKN